MAKEFEGLKRISAQAREAFCDRIRTEERERQEARRRVELRALWTYTEIIQIFHEAQSAITLGDPTATMFDLLDGGDGFYIFDVLRE